ncbi:MAG: hypothetical protein ACE5DR_04715 [Thermodesulfobacteriota bacterium]
MAAGCAHHDNAATFLYPGQYALEGYGAEADAVVFEDSSIKISARQIKDDSTLDSKIAAELLDEGFVLLSVDISNKSRHRALYDPALTSIRDSKMGYFKPLDFTDLYMLKVKNKRVTSSLKGAGDVFYDLAERVAPGGKSSKILVFPALTENVDEAELVMKSIYIGKDILDLTFNFVLRARDKEVTAAPAEGPIFK